MKNIDSPFQTDLFLKLGIGAISMTFVGAFFFLDEKVINSSEKSYQLLKEQGFQSIQIGEHYLFCQKGYAIRRHFKALNPKGEPIEGNICADNSNMPNKIESQIISPIKKTKP